MNNLIYLSFFIWIAISSLFKLSDELFFSGIYVVGIINLLYILYLQKLKKDISKRFGTIKYDIVSPKPFTSMIAGLNRNGYKIEDIKKIEFMSYDLNQSCAYIKPLIDKIILKNSDIEIDFIGFGDKDSCDNLKHKNIRYFYTDKQISEHKNLIYLKNGEVLLWYEPYHKIVNNRHHFKKGAYLISPKDTILENIKKEIDDWKEKRKQFPLNWPKQVSDS